MFSAYPSNASAPIGAGRSAKNMVSGAMDSPLTLITPVTHDLGAFTVRRTLPARTRTMVGPFIFVDQFGPARLEAGEAMDVRPHPHINLATVTYLFDGAIGHRDSLGTAQVIEPGAINLMTAGAGIVHSERTPQQDRINGSLLYGMQTWLALPDGKEEIAPAFEHVPEADLPLVEGDGVTARVLMGSLWGVTAPTTQSRTSARTRPKCRPAVPSRPPPVPRPDGAAVAVVAAPVVAVVLPLMPRPLRAASLR